MSIVTQVIFHPLFLSLSLLINSIEMFDNFDDQCNQNEVSLYFVADIFEALAFVGVDIAYAQ